MAAVPSLRELSSPSLADRAYESIRLAITRGELAPGAKITERGLAAMLAVSPTPIREAIRRLEQEGLIERQGSRTTVVAEPDLDVRRELALVEATLKSLAVRFAATNADEAALERMQRCLDEADSLRAEMRRSLSAGEPYPAAVADDLLTALRSFHVEAETACGNTVLLRMLATVNAFSFRDRAESLRERVEAGAAVDERYDEHRLVLDAIRGRDPDAAEQLMARHARQAAELYTSPAASGDEAAT